MKIVVGLLLLTTCFLKALPPFPPQMPPYPPQRNVLPTDGYFLIGWDTTAATGTQRSPNPNSVPINARANIVKIAASKSSVGGMGSTVVLNTSGCVIALQTGYSSSSEYAVPNEAKSGVVDVIVSGDYCYAIKNSGKLLIWRITDIAWANPELPEAVSSGVVSVAVRNYDSGFVVLKETGEVKSFSRDSIMVPNAPTMPYMPPGTYMPTSFVYNEIQVPSSVSSGVVQIWTNQGAGDGTIFALKNNGQVIAWNYAASVYTLRVLPDILLSGVARIKSDSLFLMQDGSVVSLFYNPAGEATASTYRGTEKDGVDVGRDLMINNTYILTKDGAVLGYDSTGNSLALNSELGSDIKEISIWNGNNFALKNTGKLLKWSYPDSALDTSLPAFTSSGIPFLGDLGSVSTLMLSSSADTAVSIYCGLPLNVLVQLVADRIKNQPSNYGIATQSGLSSAITTAVEPLATKSEITTAINEGKASGIARVTASPNDWSLFTTSQIQNMAMGDLVLNRQENGSFVLNYDIEQSTDLQNWTTYAPLSLPLTGLPTDKAFVRIKMINSSPNPPHSTASGSNMN